MAPPEGFRVLLVDYGGVLTAPPADGRAAWCAAEGIDERTFDEIIDEWNRAATHSPLGAVERGEIALAEYERHLAEELHRRTGTRPETSGLIARLFAHNVANVELERVITALRAAGVVTAVASNAWGANYPLGRLECQHDALLFSHDLRARKPEPRFYEAAAAALDAVPQACVFVDDQLDNVRGAARAGMEGVHFQSTSQVTRRLAELFPAATLDPRPGVTSS